MMAPSRRCGDLRVFADRNPRQIVGTPDHSMRRNVYKGLQTSPPFSHCQPTEPQYFPSSRSGQELG